jgi:hypothetical protein
MKHPELYQKTVDILVQAYFEDLLQHSNCSACAVANIILASHNLKPVKIHGGAIMWPISKLKFAGFQSESWYDICRFNQKPSEYWIENNKTGYSWTQLSLIEKAFEWASRGDSGDKWMFNGLMAVIDALDEIHENKDCHITNETKGKFSKAF